ncbi:unnamed protein product [Calypogeia fissa]
MARSERRHSPGTVAVIGAGISGLAAAYRLRTEGVNVTVFEAEGNVGGKLKSLSEDGYVWDFGPNSMVENTPEVGSLIDDLQLREKLQFPVLQNKRYILLDGTPVPLPSNPLGLIGSKILSTKSKLQILLEPFLWSRKPSGPESAKDDKLDESVGDFLGRHIGKETVDNLVDPFIAGTTGSEPKRLSARHTFPDLWSMEQRHGSLVMGGIKSNLLGKNNSTQIAKKNFPTSSQPKRRLGSFSFVGGLQTIATALAERIGGTNMKLNTAVVALDSKQQGNPARDEWTISSYDTQRRRKEKNKQHFDAVIMTVPLNNLQDIQFSRDGQSFPVDFIPEVTYQPMSVLITAFRKEDVRQPLQGFGVLVPSKEEANGFQTLGTLFSSSMFPDRAPSDQVMFTTFVGGSRNKELAGAPFGVLKDVVLKDLRRIVGAEGEPLAVKHFYWQRAFPEYGLKYGGVLDGLDKLEKTFPGLYYAGNHRGGLAVGKALLSGYAAAGRVIDDLEASGGRIFTMV